MRFAAVFSLLCAAGALVGCAGDASERDVSRVVERFQSALAARDGVAACAQLSGPTKSTLARDEKEPCSRAVLALDLPGGGTVTRSDVYLTSGYAEVGGGAAFLDESPHGWRISAAGCTRTEPGMPFDCELEH
jgi:hypothetical protein